MRLPRIAEILERVRRVTGDTILVSTRYWTDTVLEYHAGEDGWETHIFCTKIQCMEITIKGDSVKIAVSPAMELEITQDHGRARSTVIIS